MPQDIDDLTLIQRVVAKDRQAFEALYHRYYPRLFTFLAKLLNRHELIEEVINDVLFVVWKDATRFGHKSSLSTWIFGIAHNKALKAVSRSSEKPLTPAEPSTWQEQEAPAQEAAVARRDTKHALVQALQALSLPQRSAIELAFYHELSYQEIAQIMKCPVNTVKTRMFHARKRLGELLRGSGVQHHKEEWL